MAVTDCYDQHYGNYYSQDFKSLYFISMSICQKDKDLTEWKKEFLSRKYPKWQTSAEAKSSMLFSGKH